MAVNTQEISHLLETGRFTEGASGIKALAGGLLKCGEYSPLLSLISKIPESLKASDDDLGLIFAECLIHTGEIHQAGAILTEILKKNSEKAERWQTVAIALAWRSATHRLAGNLDTAVADAEASLAIATHDGVSSILVANAEFRLGNALLDMGRLDDAISHLQLADKLSANDFDLDLIARIQNSLGAAYLRKGDMAKAAVHFEYAREGWGKTRNSGALAATMNSQAYLCQRLGQPERAREILISALCKAQDSQSKRIESSVLIALGVVQRDLNDFEASVATLTSALSVARDVMEKNFVAWTKAELGDTYRRMGQYSQAVQTLTEAVAQATEQNQAVEVDIFNVLLGISKFMQGEHAGGLALLVATVKRLENNGDQDALARAYFFLACCYFDLKDYEGTTAFLKKTQSLVEKLGYHEFLAIDGEDFPLVIHFAGSKHVGGNLFTGIQKRVNDKLGVKHNKTDSSVASEIEAYSFGTPKVWIFAKPVGEDQWRSLRAKELFYFLLCHPRQTAEQIAAALWPDAPSDRALSNLHTNLYRARRATSPGIITALGGRFQLNKELKVYFDVTEFLDGTTPKKPEEDSSGYVERLEHALSLYQGPFMDGFQGEWIEELRRSLEDKYLRMSSELAHEYQARSEYKKAIPILEKAIRLDPYQDDLYCDLIETHIALGDRLSALRVYQQYNISIVIEMGAEPPIRLTKMLTPLLI